MTGQAIAIVGCGSADDLNVGIVAPGATHAAIAPVVAGAVRQAVGLKAHVDLAPNAVAHHLIPGAMALPAKIRCFLGGDAAELHGHGSCFAAANRCCVLRRARMTAFALDARGEALQLFLDQWTFKNCAGGMASEASFRFGIRQLAAERFEHSFRLDAVVADGDVESTGAGIEADEAFVELALMFEHPGLRVGAECPVDGDRDGCGAIGDGIGALAAARFDCVGVGSTAGGEFRIRL